MTPSPTPPRPDPQPTGEHAALAAHGAFLRRLARSLVRDEQRAEDIVQEAYVAVLQRPPPARVGLRPWLVGIVKNLARKSHRAETRRQNREVIGSQRASGQRDPLETPDDITVRLELQQRLAESVRLLEEPTRTTVVRRYYDGLTPTQIAEAEGCSVRTIESRLRRAREQLRLVLDRASGGNRGRWMLAFAPMAFDPQVLAGLLSAAQGGVAGSAAAGATAAATPALSLTGILSVLAVASAGTAGFLLGHQPQVPAAAPVDMRVPEDALSARVPAKDLAALEDQLARVQAERERLTRAVAQARMLPTPTRDEVLSTAYLEATKVPVFISEPQRSLLQQVEWPELGRALVRLNVALAELTRLSLGAGQQSTITVQAEVQRWNAPLVQFAGTMQPALPSKYEWIPNAGFSAPYAQANLLHAALLYAKLPLSASQQSAVARLAARHDRLERSAMGALPEVALHLRQVFTLAAERHKFFEAVRGLLSPAQREILQPVATRGRVGFDLFSNGAMWQMQAKAIEHVDDRSLEEHVVRFLSSALDLQTPELRAVVEDAVRRWIETYPPAGRQVGADALDRLKMFRITRVQAAAEASLGLFERLVERLPPDHPGVRWIREKARALLPIQRPSGRSK